jgi:hypothetical protein
VLQTSPSSRRGLANPGRETALVSVWLKMNAMPGCYDRPHLKSTENERKLSRKGKTLRL